MRVVVVYDVDFMKLPLLPPTIENCRKCALFMTSRPVGDCIRTDRRICLDGRNGYFAKNYMREVPDIINNALLEEEAHGASKPL
jgi:hypothetical protein